MEPDFRPGDQIIVDPDVAPRSGEIVVAKMGHEEKITLKKYRARGTDENGNEIFELVPLNHNYATLLVNADNPGRIIGTMMHYLRNMRRG
ncbi:MAG: S24 family peptidase [gamma proteobacterium endosymbiont of Lamellibrachia anaximandri]|nr:S24 family peptidase [gamma proteobacterium endosymbiont of Lamellibrachia anaximandri]MBL3619332.1 S24 family peptidase [gamma proteobacterium endosymbiont of Lamellibrachia anaximandri]